MLRRSLSLLLVLALATPLHADKARKPTPARNAAQYPFHETDAQAHVTIAAEPGTTKETSPDTRLDYGANGLLPMRIIVTNDADEPITLDDARIHFIAGDYTNIPAATNDDLQRRMFELSNAKGTKIPLPMPLPPITIHHPPVDKKILADAEDFGFKTTTVAPHTTVAGYLFYDMRDVDEPVLDHAVLELRKVRFADRATFLDSFEIQLSTNTLTTGKPAPGTGPNP